jgi:hypothetical protein
MEPITIALGLARLTGLDTKLGRWIGGDNGAAIAEKVMATAQAITGAQTPEAALQKLKHDQQLQIEFSRAVMANETELERMAYHDRADARALQKAALEQGDIFAKRFIYYLTIFWSCFAAGYVTLITFTTIPETSIRFADTILGFVLGTIIASIIAFFFGSSHGNEKRGDLQAVEKLQQEIYRLTSKG